MAQTWLQNWDEYDHEAHVKSVVQKASLLTKLRKTMQC